MHRNMSVYGKIVVFKSLALAKLSHLSRVLPSLKTDQLNDKPDKVSRDHSKLKESAGGLGMTDIGSFWSALKNREYCKRGKTSNYLQLKQQFDELYRKEAENYLNNTMTELKHSNHGKMYNILKRLGSKPGDLDDGSSFSLPSHVEQKS